jgi:serine/threonine protein phosphatase PrpC
MQVEIATCSFKGGRDYNEDSVRHQKIDDVCAVVVADGLGGHGGGDIASSVAADSMIELFMQDARIDAGVINGFFVQVNDDVLKHQTYNKRMMSTGVALFMNDNAVIWGHVGDSRLYHFKDGCLITHTLDHSVSQMAVFSGEITQEQLRDHKDRNRVLRAFGGGEEITAEISSPSVLGSGFHSFLLCTDGFWEFVFESEMEIDLAKSNKPNDWLREMCFRINNRAPKYSDNFSAASVFVYIDGE